MTSSHRQSARTGLRATTKRKAVLSRKALLAAAPLKGIRIARARDRGRILELG